MKKSYFPVVILGLLSLALIIAVVMPFWQGSLYYSDSVGHSSSGKFVAEELFPGVAGWNQEHFFGYPHNQFYPPLFSWVVALLSFVFGFELAVKLVIGAAVVILPWVIYVFGRSLKMKQEQGLLFSSIVILFLALPSFWFAPTHLGMNFDSLLDVGFLANTLSLPLLFLYMSLVPGICKKRFLLPTLILAGLVLTHFVAALIGIFYSISWAIYNFKKSGLKFIWHFIVGFLLTAWWSVPFVSNLAHTSSALIPLRLAPQIVGTILLLCVGLILLYKKGINNVVFPLGAFILLLLLFILFVHIFRVGFHTYRLVFIFYVLVILLGSLLFPSKKYIIIGLVVLVIVGIFYFVDPRFTHEPWEDREITIENVDRLFLIARGGIGMPSQQWWYLLPKWNDLQVDSGTYKESSLHASQLNSLVAVFTRRPIVWGTYVDKKSINQLPRRNISKMNNWYFKLFGIDGVLTDLESSDFSFESRELIYSKELIRFHYGVEVDGQEIRLPRAQDVMVVTDSGKIFFIDYFDGLTREILFSNESRLFISKGILYDEMVLCQGDDFYFLEKEEFPEYNVFSYRTHSLNEFIFNSTSDISCESGILFGELYKTHNLSAGNFTHLLRYYDSPMDEVVFGEINEVYIEVKESVNINYFLYRLPKSEIVIALDKGPGIFKTKGEWKDFVNGWFLNYSEVGKIYVNSDEEFRVNSERMVKNVKIEREKISFNVDSDINTPVLVKVSYFPRWRAYVEGEEVEIYQATPHFMVVNAQGNVELIYGNRWFDYLGFILSLLGILIVILNYKKERNNIKKLKR